MDRRKLKNLTSGGKSTKSGYSAGDSEGTYGPLVTAAPSDTEGGKTCESERVGEREEAREEAREEKQCEEATDGWIDAAVVKREEGDDQPRAKRTSDAATRDDGDEQCVRVTRSTRSMSSSRSSDRPSKLAIVSVERLSPALERRRPLSLKPQEHVVDVKTDVDVGAFGAEVTAEKLVAASSSRHKLWAPRRAKPVTRSDEMTDRADAADATAYRTASASVTMSDADSRSIASEGSEKRKRGRPPGPNYAGPTKPYVATKISRSKCDSDYDDDFEYGVPKSVGPKKRKVTVPASEAGMTSKQRSVLDEETSTWAVMSPLQIADEVGLALDKAEEARVRSTNIKGDLNKQIKIGLQLARRAVNSLALMTAEDEKWSRLHDEHLELRAEHLSMKKEMARYREELERYKRRGSPPLRERRSPPLRERRSPPLRERSLADSAALRRSMTPTEFTEEINQRRVIRRILSSDSEREDDRPASDQPDGTRRGRKLREQKTVSYTETDTEYTCDRINPRRRSREAEEKKMRLAKLKANYGKYGEAPRSVVTTGKDMGLSETGDEPSHQNLDDDEWPVLGSNTMDWDLFPKPQREPRGVTTKRRRGDETNRMDKSSTTPVHAVVEPLGKKKKLIHPTSNNPVMRDSERRKQETTPRSVPDDPARTTTGRRYLPSETEDPARSVTDASTGNRRRTRRTPKKRVCTCGRPVISEAESEQTSRAKRRRSRSRRRRTTPTPAAARMRSARRAERTAAVTITRVGDEAPSYADIMRKAKSGINLKDDACIETIRYRRALTGAVILEIRGPDRNKSARLLTDKLKEVLGNQEARIAHPVRRREIRVTRLDDSTTPDELVAAVAAAGNSEKDQVTCGPITMIGQRLRAAWVKCPAVCAVALANKGKLQVGWTVAKVDLIRPKPIQCYRCWAIGHISNNCPSKVNRSGCCFVCGEEGHKAASCGNAPKCPVCEAQGLPANHRAGSAACVAASKKAEEEAAKRKKEERREKQEGTTNRRNEVATAINEDHAPNSPN